MSSSRTGLMVVGLVVLVVVVSAGVYSYMEYRERIRQQEAVAALEALEAIWDEEAAYYQELTTRPFDECPGHNITVVIPAVPGGSARSEYETIGYCYVTVNKYSERWYETLKYYVEGEESQGNIPPNGGWYTLRKVTREELRQEVYKVTKQYCDGPHLAKQYYPRINDLDITIDQLERIIFIRTQNREVVYWSLYD